MLAKTFRGFPEGLPLKITQEPISTGEYVAVEVFSEATHLCGKPRFEYKNEYHFLMRVQGGKITEVKEYNDTLQLGKLYDLIQTEECQKLLNPKEKK